MIQESNNPSILNLKKGDDPRKEVNRCFLHRYNQIPVRQRSTTLAVKILGEVWDEAHKINMNETSEQDQHDYLIGVILNQKKQQP